MNPLNLLDKLNRLFYLKLSKTNQKVNLKVSLKDIRVNSKNGRFND